MTRPSVLTPADRLRAAGKLGPYTPAPTDRTQAAPAEAPPTAAVDPAAVRAWAAEHAIDVSPRGRIPAAVVDAYQQAHQEAP